MSAWHVAPGEVHALLGENGAGKSTFIKCLSGAVRPDAGAVRVDGDALPPGDLRAAEAAGIVALHQESTAFPHLSAVDNIFVGREPRRGLGLLDRPRMERETQALLDRLGETLDLHRPLEEPAPGAAADGGHGPRPVPPEPPADLGRADGLAVGPRDADSVPHHPAVAERRRRRPLHQPPPGRSVCPGKPRHGPARRAIWWAPTPWPKSDREELVRRMVGRELLAEERTETGAAEGAVLLDVRGLTRTGRSRTCRFHVRAGEIVGLAGLVGAGRSEVAEAIFGIEDADVGRR